MKIAVVSNQAPFVYGGAEYLAENLAMRLRGRGHRVDLVRLPFKWYPPQAVLEHMLAAQLLNLATDSSDLVIALKFPAYLTPFANKKIWLLHQFRQVYELWGTPYAGMPDDIPSRRVRDAIAFADTQCLSQTKGLFALSRMIAARLKRNNGLLVEDVLNHPLDRPELYGPGESGPYFFYPSRLNEIKRQHIAIEAMRHVRSDFRLVLAGKPDPECYGQELKRLVETWGLQGRVQFLGWISEEEKARWMAGAFAALYLPFDEDSYGYVTLEAFHSHKPVLTFTDSGGTDELVEHEVNGLMLEPTPQSLAMAMEALWAGGDRVRQMGRAAAETLVHKRIHWDNVLDRLAG